MQRTVGEYLRTPMTARSALMQVGLQAILVGARAKASLSLPHRFVGEEAISALTGLHYKTKLHSTEVDSVPTSQCKAQRCECAGKVLEERHLTPVTTRRKTGPESR
jgi:hypothetical protein